MTITTKFRPSHRGSSPSVAEQLQARAREVEAAGSSVIYLHVGQPSTGAPAGTLQAIEAASHHSTLGYTDAAGTRALRERLALEVRRRATHRPKPRGPQFFFGVSNL